MELNISMENVALFVGGDPSKGMLPLITSTIKHLQILIDQEKNKVVIIETK
jgi:hypothetical protein